MVTAAEGLGIRNYEQKEKGVLLPNTQAVPPAKVHSAPREEGRIAGRRLIVMIKVTLLRTRWVQTPLFEEHDTDIIVLTQEHQEVCRIVETAPMKCQHCERERKKKRRSGALTKAVQFV